MKKITVRTIYPVQISEEEYDKVFVFYSTLGVTEMGSMDMYGFPVEEKYVIVPAHNIAGFLEEEEAPEESDEK